MTKYLHRTFEFKCTKDNLTKLGVALALTNANLANGLRIYSFTRGLMRLPRNSHRVTVFVSVMLNEECYGQFIEITGFKDISYEEHS